MSREKKYARINQDMALIWESEAQKSKSGRELRGNEWSSN